MEVCRSFIDSPTIPSITAESIDLFKKLLKDETVVDVNIKLKYGLMVLWSNS